MSLLTSVTLFVTLSVATSIYCGKGIDYHGGGESYVEQISCESNKCKITSYPEKSVSVFDCGSCPEAEIDHCYECDWDMCNYDEISGAGHLPTTVSLLVPAVYFLAKLA